MQLRLGAYQFTSNAARIRTFIEPLWAGGTIYAHKHRWDVDGWLSGSGQAELTTEQLALEAALKRPRQDLVFLRDNGSESATVLKNANSTTGVMITHGPEFASDAGNEYATERHFKFTAEAEYPVTGATTLLLEWSETISISGGGPLYLHKPSLYGSPQKQLLYKQTPYTARQAGHAKGYRIYPTPPAPLFPGALKQAPELEETSPDRRAPGSYSGFSVRWSYQYESATPLVGHPNLWR